MTTDGVPARGTARSIGSTVVTRGLDAVATWAFFVVASRSLGPESFGRFAFALAAMQLGVVLARRGLDQAVLIGNRSSPALRFVLRRVALSGVVVAVGAVILFSLTSTDDLAASLILAAAIPVMAFAQLTIGVLRAEGMVVAAAAAEGIAQPAAALAAALIAGLVAPTPAGFAIAYAGSWVLPLLFATRLRPSATALDAGTARHLIEVGQSMLVVALLSYATASADIILLGLSATAADVARYAVAQKIAAVFLIVHGAVSAASGPFARDAAGSPALIQRYYAMATRWTLMLSLPLLVVTIGAPRVVLQLFGQEYVQASSMALMVLSFAAVAYLVTGPISMVLLCTKQATRLTRLTAFHALFVVVGVAVGSVYGVTGAAMGLLAGNVAGRSVLVLAVRDLLQPLDAAALSLVASGAIGVILVRVLAGHLHDASAVAVGVVTTTLIATAVLQRTGDLRFLRMEFGRPPRDR